MIKDSHDIREGLIERIEKAPAGGVFHEVRVERLSRNSFCLQLGPEQPIFTVTINYGGALRSKVS